MKRFRSLIGQSPVIAVSITALVLSLACGATAASVVQSASTVTWHRLTLVNGWTSSQNQFGTGAPSYAVSNGVVYLSGSMHETSPTGDVFSILPPGARPRHGLYITIYTNYQHTGTLHVDANGTLRAYSPDVTSAQLFSSLAGISFPLGS